MSKTITGDLKELATCICPKCGIEHKIIMHWTGKGIPKKFCKSGLCKPKTGMDEVHASSLSRNRIAARS